MNLLPGSFANRLTLILSILALCTGLPGYLYLDHIYAHQLVEDRGSALTDLARGTANALTENLRERQREIDLLAQTALFRQANFGDPELTDSVERLQVSYPNYSWIGFADNSGLVRASVKNLLLNVNVSQRPWFSIGLKTSYIGDLHTAVLLAKLLPAEPAGQGPVRFLDIATPVTDKQGKLRGVLAAHAHWSWATELVQANTPANAKTDGIEIFIVDKNNHPIYPDNLPESLKVPVGAGSHPHFAFDRWGSDTDYLTARVGIREISPLQPLGWQVLVRQPANQALARVHDLQRAIFLSAAAMAIVLLFLGRWVSGLFGEPLEQLAAVAKRIEQGEENLHWPTKERSTEMGHLTAALRGMSATLISRKQALADANVHLEKKVEERTAALALANDELRVLARKDALTGLGNRLASMERLREEFVRMQRHKQLYTALVLDVDFFKKVNDTFGHAVGDAVLRDVARTIRTTVRETDFVGRTGGEEFLVLLPATPLADAMLVAEKIRNAIASHPQPTVGTVTASIGVSAALANDVSEDAAVSRADAALYRAKEAGRNRVEAHQAT